MSRKFNTFTIASVALSLLSGIVLTGCSSSDDDANKCCPIPQIGWHNGDTDSDDSVNDDGGGAAGIMLAEDGEFSILPVEEPIIIDDQETGGDDGSDGNSFKDIWQQQVDDHQESGGDEVDYSVL